RQPEQPGVDVEAPRLPHRGGELDELVRRAGVPGDDQPAGALRAVLEPRPEADRLDPPARPPPQPALTVEAEAELPPAQRRADVLRPGPGPQPPRRVLLQQRAVLGGRPRLALALQPFPLRRLLAGGVGLDAVPAVLAELGVPDVLQAERRYQDSRRHGLV